MSESIADRVTEILEDAERGSDDLEALDGEDLPGDLEESGLLGTAEEASDLVEEEDASELLAALGLDELEDGTEPDSLPEAIALGGEERIGDLQVLVKLAKIAGADDAELDDEVGGLREALDARIGSDEDEESDGETEGEESLAESAADAVQDAVTGEDGDAEDGTGFIEEGIESAMRSRLEGFGGELDEARAHLDSLREDDEARADDPEDGRSRDEGEDAPLGSDSRPRSRGTMHSTMAPSPSRRADMGTSTRHSTMPDR